MQKILVTNLHFLSAEPPELTHLECIEKACRAGVDWVQLRVKNKPLDEIIAIAKQSKIICDSYGIRLIINDHPSIAKAVAAYGLHLGKEDMSVTEARKIVGDEMIIGGTANTIEDVITHAKNGVNYIGCGPFRFTRTKAKLSPVLGLDGYKNIQTEAKRLNIQIPIIAIGGIETEDIAAILQTGISGVAVSSLIAFASDPKQEVSKIKELLKGENIVC
ncbi:MAG: thiamine phosphate synthase [Sphingobacteriaceae bacterium]